MNQSLKVALLILGLIACVSACMKLETTDASAESSAPKSQPESFGVTSVGWVHEKNLLVITDPKTQCQYIAVQDGGITPRMHSDGIQVCGESTYPNGEH